MESSEESVKTATKNHASDQNYTTKISSARLAKNNIQTSRRKKLGLVVSGFLAKEAQLIRIWKVLLEWDCALVSAARFTSRLISVQMSTRGCIGMKTAIGMHQLKRGSTCSVDYEGF